MTIKILQTRLVQAGFSVGVLDGAFGPRTLSALMGFIAQRQPDEAIIQRAKAILTYWKPYSSDREPQGWTRLRMIHFLAQCCHETGGWKHFEENLNYRDPVRLDQMFSLVKGVDDAKALIAKGPVAIGNRVYAGRNGNGPESSGDGYAMRGQGDLQITGRTNYKLYGDAVALNLVEHPDIVQQPDVSVRVSLAYWRLNSCNAPADQDNSLRITKIINGPALEGKEHRKALVERAKSVWI